MRLHKEVVREQQGPAADGWQVSPELLVALAQAMPSLMGHHAVGSGPDGQS